MANEKRLIDAHALIEEINQQRRASKTSFPRRSYVVGDVLTSFYNAPTVDAVEVVHGRWEPHFEVFDDDPSVGAVGGRYQTGWQCSVCGRYEYGKEPYCNCGAKMDGKLK